MCEETMDEMMYEWIIYWAVDKKSSEAMILAVMTEILAIV